MVEAHGCDPGALADMSRFQQLLDALVHELPLHPLGHPLWHKFPGAGGITDLCLLAESHFACHSFPEHGSLCLNLFCCRPRPDWRFEEYLRAKFGAAEVQVRRFDRPYGVPR